MYLVVIFQLISPRRSVLCLAKKILYIKIIWPFYSGFFSSIWLHNPPALSSNITIWSHYITTWYRNPTIWSYGSHNPAPQPYNQIPQSYNLIPQSYNLIPRSHSLIPQSCDNFRNLWGIFRPAFVCHCPQNTPDVSGSQNISVHFAYKQHITHHISLLSVPVCLQRRMVQKLPGNRHLVQALLLRHDRLCHQVWGRQRQKQALPAMRGHDWVCYSRWDVHPRWDLSQRERYKNRYSTMTCW